MKKIITTTLTLVTLFSSTAALAKTAGNYAELDLLYSSASHKYAASNIVASNYPKFDDSSIGVGASYKYALNFDKIFLAPGVFFDKIGTNAADKDLDTISLNHRYGVKLDLGYDITDKFAAYVTNGFATTIYQVDWKSIGQKKSGSKVAYFFGAGLAYSVADNVTMNAELNMTSFDVSTPSFGGINNAKTDLAVAKIGVAYHF